MKGVLLEVDLRMVIAGGRDEVEALIKDTLNIITKLPSAFPLLELI